MYESGYQTDPKRDSEEFLGPQQRSRQRVIRQTIGFANRVGNSTVGTGSTNVYNTRRSIEAGLYHVFISYNDNETDKAGERPEDLKRGVLSEDALYNLLAEQEDRIMRLCSHEEGGTR